MNVFKRFGRFVKNVNKKKLTLGVVAAAILVPALAWGAMVANTKIAEAKMARDCDGNAIMYCGAVNTGEFADKYGTNKTGDLDNIYSAYGMSPSELSRFQKTAKMGYVTKSGDVVLDGKVVATGARSLGRHYIPGSSTKTINGKKYYERATSVSFASNSIPALIMMNGDQVEFVSLTSCGNPVWNKPKGNPPVYKCDSLTKRTIDKDTFAFSSKATAQNGAKIDKVVYDFGDGTKKEEKNPATEVEHTYKPGKYTAKVTVYFTVNGETKTHTSTECSKPVEVEQPPKPVYECVGLAAKLVPPSKQKYSFTATAKAENGAVLQSGSFDFGDGQKADNVNPSGNTVTSEHEYTTDGTYTVTATLKFNVGETTKEVKCQTTVKPETPKPPVYECTGLSVMQKSRTEFSFKASSKVENAELVGYRYAVHSADGVAAKDLGPNETFDYTALKDGTYTVRAQVIVKVDGQVKETPVSALCTKTFEVKPEEKPPVAECVALNATLRSGTRDTYDYAVETKVEGKAKVVSYSYNFGDGSAVQNTTSSTTNHTYATAGNWISRVTVTFEVDGQQVQKTSDACAAETPVVPPEECKPGIPIGDERCEEKPEECKPGIPVGDARCQECKPGIPMGDERCEECKPGVPMNDERCEEQPQELPQTGMTALGSAAGLSSLIGAGYYWRGSRRNLLSRLRVRGLK